jgi:4-hydroxyphenylacetate 3-monooxygenase
LIDLTLTIQGDKPEQLEIKDPNLVVAGYTGRNTDDVMRHIEELEAHGIPRPPSVPTYWVLPNWLLLTSGARAQVISGRTSGEIEPVIIRAADRKLFVAAGSDHTDRHLEATSLTLAKLTCPKIISSEVRRYEDIEPMWDEVSLRSYTDGGGEPYQDGSLAQLRRPPEILAQVDKIGLAPERALVLFLGTVPLQRGEFVFARAFAGALEAPIDGWLLTCKYDIDTISNHES